MDTLKRLTELIDEREITLFKLATMSGIPYPTLRNCETRGGQLSVDTIEKLCCGLGITLSEFFATET